MQAQGLHQFVITYLIEIKPNIKKKEFVLQNRKTGFLESKIDGYNE